MSIAGNRKVRLVPNEDEAFTFRIVDAETGRELTPAEVEAMQVKSKDLSEFELEPGARGLAAKPLRVCGEGDSWINLLSDISGFPKTFFDVLGASFPTRNIGFPGDTFDNMLAKKQYKQLLQSGLFRVFVFSGGGNDILGGGGLVRLLKKKSEGNGSSDPADYIRKSELASVLHKLDAGYRKVAAEAKAFEPDVLMLVHGYDYAIPRKNGKWLGTPLKNSGFAHDEPLAPKIIAFLVDQYNALLKSVDKDVSHVRHIDVRGTIKTLWHDELHPKTSGAKLVSKLFEKEIGKLLVS